MFVTLGVIVVEELLEKIATIVDVRVIHQLVPAVSPPRRPTAADRKVLLSNDLRPPREPGCGWPPHLWSSTPRWECFDRLDGFLRNRSLPCRACPAYSDRAPSDRQVLSRAVRSPRDRCQPG